MTQNDDYISKFHGQESNNHFFFLAFISQFKRLPGLFLNQLPANVNAMFETMF